MIYYAAFAIIHFIFCNPGRKIVGRGTELKNATGSGLILSHQFVTTTAHVI